MELAVWQTLAFACVFLVFFVYSILDGFDLGLGILMPFVAKNDADRGALLRTIAPFWDGNEVWLVIGSSSLFAAFPEAYAKLLPAFYLPFLFVIFFFIARIVSLELSYASGKISKPFVDVFSAASLLASVAGLMAIGMMVSGIPSGEDGAFKLTLEAVLPSAPTALLIAASFLLLMLTHTVSYLIRKTEGTLKATLSAYGKELWLLYLIALAATASSLLLKRPELAAKPLLWAGVALAVGASVAYRLSFGSEAAERRLFLFSSLAMGGLWLIAAAALFPNIVNPAKGTNPLVTVYNSSSPLNTLKLVVVIALAGAAAISAYTGFVYKTLARKTGSKAS